jgi:stearoyl-CoA desaturase (delta-9 desaturase)
MSAARAGFRWWELDLSYVLLWCLARLHVVWDLHPVAPSVRHQPVPQADADKVHPA